MTERSTSGSDDDDPGRYGRMVAQWYDQWYQQRPADDGIAAFLRDRAGAGPAMEIGVGTGRVASRLRAEGVEVVGIDVSPEMLERCRSTHPELPVIAMHAGDIDCLVRLRPSLIYCTMATFFQIGARQAQIEALTAAAACAAPGAVLVIDAWQPPPDLTEIPPSSITHQVSGDQVLVTIMTHDPVERSVHYRQVFVNGDIAHVVPRTDHYLYPDEVAAAAGAAGWQLEECWSDFASQHLTASSAWFVQIFRLR